MDDMGRMQDLVDRLNRWARAYYMEDDPLVSDAEYDGAYDELQALEQATGSVLPDSPTRRVGGEPLTSFASHPHRAPLWSMDKVRTADELKVWDERLRRLLQEKALRTGETFAPLRYGLEYKLDGLTLNLTYEGGKLIQAATRGDGVVGEAILPQVQTIRSIPLSIPFMGAMEVQGEGIMPLSALRDFNEQAEERGEEPLKNARNAAAGALRNLDPSVTSGRKLAAYFYNIGLLEGAIVSNQRQMLDFLKNNGFPMSPYYREYDDIDALAQEIERVGREDRDRLDYLIDGMVVKVMDFATREALGYTQRAPRWEIAYKFKAQEVTTRVQAVTW